jgi:hypothetical protein
MIVYPVSYNLHLSKRMLTERRPGYLLGSHVEMSACTITHIGSYTTLDTQPCPDMHSPPACQHCKLGRRNLLIGGRLKPFLIRPQPMHHIRVSCKLSAALAEPAVKSSLVMEV